MTSDRELLQRYLSEGSEAAFTELVSRHLGMVYQAALRRVGGNAHAADDVTQRVFTDLSRKARSLLNHSNLVGWLYTGTRYAAAEVVRSETRRRRHEQEATAMTDLPSTDSAGQDLAIPFLDDILDALPKKDREAVLLHAVENLSFVDVGRALGLSADAARMKVNRALDRARTLLTKRGIASTAMALGASLSARARTLPAHLSAAAVAQSAMRSGPTVLSTPLLGLKFTRPGAWIGGAVLFCTLTVTTWYLAHPQPNAGNPQSVSRPFTKGSADLPPGTAGPGDPPAKALAQPDAEIPFSALASTEKLLLKRLWTANERHPQPDGVRVNLRIRSESKAATAIDPLLRRGWIALGQTPEMVGLSKGGYEYCLAHQEQLDAIKVVPVRVGE